MNDPFVIFALTWISGIAGAGLYAAIGYLWTHRTSARIERRILRKVR